MSKISYKQPLFLVAEKSHVELREQMAKYVHRLQDLPAYILESDHVTKFFRSDDADHKHTGAHSRGDSNQPMSDSGSASDDYDSDVGDEFKVPPAPLAPQQPIVVTVATKSAAPHSKFCIKFTLWIGYISSRQYGSIYIIEKNTQRANVSKRQIFIG